MAIRVTIWHEYRHDNPNGPKPNATCCELYPQGMHVALQQGLEELLGDEVSITLATLDQDEQHGLSDELLANTDVMTWWGHCAHGEVKDPIAAKVAQRVREGMGLVVLHSGHYAKPFKMLMGTNCHLKWREAAETERLWVVSPGHPITAGLGNDHIQLDRAEMYGEHFDIPDPDELVFISWFEGGEVFRSGCVWKRGAGKVFYFRPGHETFPLYFDPEIRRVIANGVKYVAPAVGNNAPLRPSGKTPYDGANPGAPDGGVVPYRDGSPCIKQPLSEIKAQHDVDESIH